MPLNKAKQTKRIRPQIPITITNNLDLYDIKTSGIGASPPDVIQYHTQNTDILLWCRKCFLSTNYCNKFFKGFPNRIVANALNCNITVSEFKLQSGYYIHF